MAWSEGNKDKDWWARGWVVRTLELFNPYFFKIHFSDLLMRPPTGYRTTKCPPAVQKTWRETNAVFWVLPNPPFDLDQVFWMAPDPYFGLKDCTTLRCLLRPFRNEHTAKHACKQFRDVAARVIMKLSLSGNADNLVRQHQAREPQMVDALLLRDVWVLLYLMRPFIGWGQSVYNRPTLAWDYILNLGNRLNLDMSAWECSYRESLYLRPLPLGIRILSGEAGTSSPLLDESPWRARRRRCLRQLRRTEPAPQADGTDDRTFW